MRSSSKGQTAPISTVDWPLKKPYVPVSEWLSTRFILRSLSDSVIESCYDQILNVFCDRRETISTLIGASTSIQITQIMNILKNAQLEDSEKSRTRSTISKIAENGSNSLFSFLSTESIYNICEFLENVDINSLKMTSTFISLIAFDIMKTYKIGVFNMNELIEQKDYKYPLHLNLNRKIKMNHIKPWTKCKSLTSVYSKRYNIPLSQMLILQSFKSHGFSVSMGIDYAIYNNSLCKSKIVKNMMTFNQRLIEKRREFFIFDRDKINIVNNDNYNELQTISTIDIESDHDSNIVLLQYFDIKQQRLQNVQFLWLNCNTSLPRFEQYIHKDLLSAYSIRYKYLSHCWCLELLQTMHDMMQFETECNILNIYYRKRVNVNAVDYVRYSSRRYSRRNELNDEMDKDFTIITFELNANHPYFNNISSNIIKQSYLNEPFYRNVSDYVTDRTSRYNIEIEYIYNKDRMMQHLKYFDVDHARNTHFIITPLTRFGMIKQRIVNRFKGVLSVKDIEIFRIKKVMASMWNKESNNDAYCVVSVESNEREIAKNHINYSYRFEVIPHDLCGDDYHVYNIAIYDHPTEDNVFKPFDIECNEAIKEIHVKYGAFKQKIMKKKVESNGNMNNDGFVSLSMNNNRKLFVECTENIQIQVNVIDFMNKILKMMSHAMYRNEYQCFVRKYHETSKYGFVIMKDDMFYDECTPCFCYDNDINYLNINLLIVHNVYMDDTDKKKYAVMVRFNTEDENHCFGYPLRVWITKQTKLHDIVGLRYFKNKYILSSCLATKYCIAIYGNDIIYDKVYSDHRLPQLLITLRASR